MPVMAEVEIARADLNDDYGVSLWARSTLTDLTPEQARTLAAELVRVADEAERMAADDRAAEIERMDGRPVVAGREERF